MTIDTSISDRTKEENMMYFLLLLSVSLSPAAADTTYMNVSLNLTAVPKDIPTTAVDVHLTDNLIEEIPADVFNTHLSLKTLRFEHNLLSEFPDLRSIAQSLLTLYLSNNRINVIDSERLNDLSQLIRVDLQHNFIHTLPVITISNLHTIFLDGNSLTEFPNIEHRASLAYLGVPWNDIGSFPDNYFMSMPSLKMLNVMNNPRLTDTITLPVGSSQITHLYAASTSITEIPAQTMTSMDKLTWIQLSNVSSVHFSCFSIYCDNLGLLSVHHDTFHSNTIDMN